MQLNIPTWFTLFRIFMIPFFLLAFYLPFRWTSFCCTLIFILAAITDWFDGFLARRWKQTTYFGAFLDPVVDKIMVTIALVLIIEHFHSWWITLPAATMIAREIIISALREWMAEIGKRSNMTVSWVGKIKTTAQMFALVTLLCRSNGLVFEIGIATLHISAILTFFSMFQYLYAARRDLFKK
ncbi:CDP-diacylglycerol--glycerol-3-phosphate 3-phosphatidyltransferase [Sodalis sp. CWE]|uniref:CDP-diacylglycerol--glycerol-3-phosphate 3-phosphatidyltransferase n=1 Tax=Sodalis sp. CWE TaxID=2803816 RepID=UPI001C7D2E3C|nr:CDP-diacylglycerol--glycerol-3-phosphate 3-phosphatidyltransferase [Sodalis sp. CWE]MBX4181034.1 CDP-diacylglycerol--glycerol-3-phosphate 3-phosphatidyltransferase [Sodalis sp. CWE]